MCAVMCAMHPFLGEPSVPAFILLRMLVGSNSFGSPVSYMSPVPVRTYVLHVVIQTQTVVD